MDSYEPPRNNGVGIGTVIIVAGLVSGLVSVMVVAFGFMVYIAATGGAGLDGAREHAYDEEADGSDWSTPIHADPARVIESTFAADDRSPHIYSFDLPDDAVYVRAELEGGDVDLDLRVTFGEQAARDGEWRITADSTDGVENAWLVRHDDAKFAREPFIVRVDNYTEDSEDAPYTLELTVVRSSPGTRLSPGDTAHGVVSLESGHRAEYEVVLPAGVDAIRVDLTDVRQNLDLAADVKPVLDAAHAAAVALTPIGKEGLVLDRGALRLGPGEQVLHVLVLDRNWLDREIPFAIRVSKGSEVPDDIRRLPELPAARNDAELAALSVVAILAGEGEGSGVIVGRDRRILTAAHVVEDLDIDAADVVISLTTDIAREPEELLRGRVIRRDNELDIAIVEITSTLHGDPLPDDWNLPSIPLRRDQPTVLGEEVHACGYPVLHTSSERAEITWTTGVVSGFESPGGYALVRFDAEISSGSSGGALLDDEHRLIGITIAMHGDLAAFSATGLALPLSEIPSDWLPLLR